MNPFRSVIGFLVLVGVILLFGWALAPSAKGHSPYDPVISSLTVGLAHADNCTNLRCVRADVTPMQCESALGENCACTNVPPCGSPGAQCQGELCE